MDICSLDPNSLSIDEKIKTIREYPELIHLLDGCIVDNLSLYRVDVTHLPDNLTVNGYLDLEGCTSLHLPDNLTVGGWLDLKGCTSLTCLPDNLVVGGGLDLRDCTSLTHLPDNLTVNEWLDLEGCTSLSYKTKEDLPCIVEGSVYF